MAVETAKPNVGGTTNPQGGEIGYAGTVFKIKMDRFQFAASTRVEETTGDGDASPAFEHNGLLYMRVSILGFMVPSQAMGLANLASHANNPADVDLLLTSTRKLSVDLVAREVLGNWNRVAVTIPVRIVGHVSATAAAEIEAAVGGG